MGKYAPETFQNIIYKTADIVVNFHEFVQPLEENYFPTSAFAWFS